MTAFSDPVIELYEIVHKNPSTFGRLLHIAGLWNPETSTYERGLPARFRGALVSQALSKWHQAFFLDWLARPLAEKERDVALFWNAGTRAQSVKLRDLGEAAIPPLVRNEERQLFLQDLSFIQALL